MELLMKGSHAQRTAANPPDGTSARASFDNSNEQLALAGEGEAHSMKDPSV